MIIGIMNLNFFGTKKKSEKVRNFWLRGQTPPLESIFGKNSWRHFFTAPKMQKNKKGSFRFWNVNKLKNMNALYKFLQVEKGIKRKCGDFRF